MGNYSIETTSIGNREYNNILDNVELLIDMKKQRGMNPGAAFLASLASCKLVSFVELAKKYAIDVKDIKLIINGISENGEFLEGTHQPISSFKEINIILKIKSDNTDEELKEYLKIVDAACTVGNTVKAGIIKEILIERI